MLPSMDLAIAARAATSGDAKDVPELRLYPFSVLSVLTTPAPGAVTYTLSPYCELAARRFSLVSEPTPMTDSYAAG